VKEMQTTGKLFDWVKFEVAFYRKCKAKFTERNWRETVTITWGCCSLG